MEMRAKAVGYVRVSTEGQAQEGVSLEAQRARIKAWSEANGYTLLAVHVDAGISGFKATNRPGLQAALADSCKNKAALVVYSLSRLARSTKDAIAISEKLEKAGADLVSLSERIDTTSAAGKMVFRMLAVLSEFERDVISERTKSAMGYLRSQRRFLGSIPLGFKREGNTLVIVPEEQTIARRIRAMRAKGKASFGGISDRLNAEKVPTKNGGRWSTSTVFSICQNPIYGAIQ